MDIFFALDGESDENFSIHVIGISILGEKVMLESFLPYTIED